jgi:type IV fimbrial biogenesis protein FimT
VLVLIRKVKVKQLGFNLIELMVTIAVFGIIMAIAIPSFKTMMKNSQVRNAAESVSNGLLKARAEAVSRNTRIDFILGAGTSWTIRQVSPVEVIESRPSKDGSADVTLTAVDGANVAATTVSFTSLGGILNGSAPIEKIDFTAVGSDRDLRVIVGLAGKVKMCDPNLTDSTSPRACP